MSESKANPMGDDNEKPNPYVSPKTVVPAYLRKSKAEVFRQRLRRSLVVLGAIFLIPPASVIAAVTTCTFAHAALQSEAFAFFVGWSVLAGVAAALIYISYRLYKYL